MDQTTIKTLYVFVEIAIDSSHVAQSVRLNFPNDRHKFRETLLEAEYSNEEVPIGNHIGPSRHLRIVGPLDSDDSSNQNVIPSTSTTYESTRLALVSTIQFVAALQKLKEDLTNDAPDDIQPAGLLSNEASSSKTPIDESSGAGGTPKPWSGKYEAMIPRSKPLSPGEILGCTAPRLGDVDALMYTLFIIHVSNVLILPILVTWATVVSIWKQ
jgi:2-(3-amino-3-carboxypropyl)histidine synthase